jgi:hypothetical protein
LNRTLQNSGTCIVASRSRAKVLPITDANGFILATTGIVAAPTMMPMNSKIIYARPSACKQLLQFTSERTFAWIDKFHALLVRFDRKAAHFMSAHYIVYALINLRHLLADEKSQ